MSITVRLVIGYFTHLMFASKFGYLIQEEKVLSDAEPEVLLWDYFLTNYERDLQTLTIEELVRSFSDNTIDELKTDLEKMRNIQRVFERSS